MQDEITTPCTRDDLRVDAVMTVSADDNGMPVYDVPCADPVEDQPYWCVTCDKTFQDWDQALAHLPTVRTSDGKLVKVEVA